MKTELAGVSSFFLTGENKKYSACTQGLHITVKIPDSEAALGVRPLV